VSSWIGIASTAGGVVSDATGDQFAIPALVWWLLAIGALITTAVKIESDLIKEKEKNKVAEPTMPLHEVVERALGTKDVFGGVKHYPSGEPYSENRDAILQVFSVIRERAQNGQLAVFGRIN
jgi:hypothetical protein